MQYKKYINNDHKTVVIETTGTLNYDFFSSLIKESKILLYQTDYKKVLINNEHASVVDLTAMDIRKIVEDCSLLNKELKNGMLAMVLLNDIDYGLGNMWRAYCSEMLSYSAMLFRSSKDAYFWLASL